MKSNIKITLQFIIYAAIFGTAAFALALIMTTQTAHAQAACATTTAPPTTFGQVKQSVTVDTAGTYQVWSRIKTASAADDSYFFQVNNGCAFAVGGNSATTGIPQNSWYWVNFHNGTTASRVTVNLPAGTHQLTYTGREANVQLDKVLLVSDASCVPTGMGENCSVSDQLAPSVRITAPAAGSTINAGSNVNITTDVSDNVGITKVEFFVDGVLKSTASASPYSYAWPTTGVSAGAHALTARAYDAAGNSTLSTAVNVTIAGSTTPTPTPTPTPGVVQAPYRINAGGPAYRDAGGRDWAADKYFVGGQTVNRGATLAISNTENDALYQTERYGLSSYNIPIANGTYVYRLHFAETYAGCNRPGCRVQSISVENTTALTRLDVSNEVGPNAALIKQGTVTVNDGNVTIGFTPHVQQPMINGIEILPVESAADNQPPSVSLTLPVAGSSHGVGSTVNLTANATDNKGVARVEFYRNGTLIGTDTTSPYSVNWNTTGLTVGNFNLSARAYDTSGLLGVSSLVPVQLVVAQPRLLGDANNDGKVNSIDYDIVSQNLGKNYPPADFNGDGLVGEADLTIVLDNWTW